MTLPRLHITLIPGNRCSYCGSINKYVDEKTRLCCTCFGAWLEKNSRGKKAMVAKA